jgi:phosphatidylglycerophosphate synthase
MDRRMSRQELEKTFSAEKAAQDGLLSNRVYRQLSFVVTPWFLNAGISANAVSCVGLFCSAMMPLVAVLLGPYDYLGLALLIVLYLVLDCVDGNVARVVGSSGPLGQYLDSLAGKLYALGRTLALGIVAARELPMLGLGTWVSLAFFSVLLFIWGRESRQYLKITGGGTPDQFVVGWGRLRDLALGFTELIPLGLIVLGPLGYAWLTFVGLFFFYTALFAYSQVRIFRQLMGPGPQGPA